jgi:hypothetical protein
VLNRLLDDIQARLADCRRAWWTIRRFLIPREWIGALQDVPTKDLAKLDIWPDGSAIELEDRDIHISVA